MRLLKDENLPQDLQLEGKDSEWIVLDLGQYVVHVMTPDAADMFDLQGVWQNNMNYFYSEQ